MAPKTPIINTDEISKKIGLKLYFQLEKNGVTQLQLSEKLEISQANLSNLLTGRKTTGNLDQYWKIAEAIPISRQEFDKIVETAKAEVLGFSEHNSWTVTDEVAYATLSRSHGMDEEDIKKAIDIYKMYQKK